MNDKGDLKKKKKDRKRPYLVKHVSNVVVYACTTYTYNSGGGRGGLFIRLIYSMQPGHS